MENNQIETDSSKVKVVEVNSKGEVSISYRDMTPEEIEMGQFFKKLMGGLETKSTPQSSAIVKYNNEV